MSSLVVPPHHIIMTLFRNLLIIFRLLWWNRKRINKKTSKGVIVERDNVFIDGKTFFFLMVSHTDFTTQNGRKR